MCLSRIGTGYGIGWVILSRDGEHGVDLAGRKRVPGRGTAKGPSSDPALASRRAGLEGDRPRQGRPDPDRMAAEGRVWPRARPWWSVRAAAMGCWRWTTKGSRSPSGSTPWGSRRSSSSTDSGRVTTIRRCSRTPAVRSARCARDASQWKLDPHKIAILGFSAGGHLASTAGTHFDAGKPDADDPIERVSSRPDRMILVYPVIALATPYGHSGSLRNLLGDKPSRELVESLSNERQVTKETPPTFLAHTNADKGVPGREQPAVRPGAAEGRRPGRAAPLRTRSPWPRTGQRHRRFPRPCRALLQSLAQALRDLAQEPGVPRPGIGHEIRCCRRLGRNQRPGERRVGRFPTTHWSRLVRVGGPSDPEARAALEALCRDYWFPLYAFIRGRGHSSHEAEDLVQGFLAQLLERGDLARLDRSKGRFRSFLRAACDHYLATSPRTRTGREARRQHLDRVDRPSRRREPICPRTNSRADRRAVVRAAVGTHPAQTRARSTRIRVRSGREGDPLRATPTRVTRGRSGSLLSRHRRRTGYERRSGSGRRQSGPTAVSRATPRGGRPDDR